MTKSARELFEEAMQLDPRERATLMRLLVDSLDAESEEGAEEVWRAEIERRIAELDSGQIQAVSWEELERGCTSTEWPQRRPGSILLQRRRRHPRMTGMPREVPRPRTGLGRSCSGRSTRSQRVPALDRALRAARGGTCFLDTPSAWCTSCAVMPSRSSRWPTVVAGPAIGSRVSDGPSNFRMQRSERRAAADPERRTDRSYARGLRC